jgi:hypothetical protein
MHISTALRYIALFSASLPITVTARPGRTLQIKRENVESSTQAGVFLTPPSGLSFTAIAAVVTTPTSVTVPPGAPAGNYYGSAWIGLDGISLNDSCHESELIQFKVTQMVLPLSYSVESHGI